MTDKQYADLKLALNYLLAVALGAAIASGTVLLGQLQAGGITDWTPIVAAALASLLTALRTAGLDKAIGAPSPLSAHDVGRVADALLAKQAKTRGKP